MRLALKIALRIFLSSRRTAGPTILFSLAGIIIGVAFLVVAMAVMSGFENTLKNAVIDVSGDLIVTKRSRHIEPWSEVDAQLKSMEPSIKATAPFFQLEVVAANKGKILGVMLQGVDPVHTPKVLNIQSRLINGKFDISYPGPNKPVPAVVGKEFLKEMNLQIGDVFRVVLPVLDELNPNAFSRRVGSFQVAGVVDLGKYEYNQRWVVTHLNATQDLAGTPNKYTGVVVKLFNSQKARIVAGRLSDKLGPPWWIKDWHSVNENLFEAVKIEKFVVFIVILIIVIAAAFNVTSTLFISVVQRFHMISVLKAVGAKSDLIKLIFSLQGLLIGGVGLGLGLLLGFGMCWGFVWMQKHFLILTGSVYKIDFIIPEIRAGDWGTIVATTLGICWISTLAPAAKGANLNPTEGLRYE